jgi:hypothetical protein
MTAEVAILERLKADTAVSALAGARVYQLKLPQKPTLPAVRVQLISEPADLHLRGVSSLYRSRIQVDAFAHESDANNPDPYGTVTELADAIDGALHGKAFDSTDSPASVRVFVCQRESRMPLYDAAELRQVRVVQDYFVHWRKMSA